MLLVIVGAGASFDSIPSLPPSGAPETYRPPLANQLFEPRQAFEGIQRAVPQVMQIAPSLMRRAHKESVEDVLERYAGQVADYPERAIQLAAVRFYLQGIISSCEDNWYRQNPVATNMMALIDQIECVRRGRERPIFATFNYDRIIENALENRGQRFDGLKEYVDGGIPVYKLHGSVDWMRRIRLERVRFHGSGWPLAKQICDAIPTLPRPGMIERADEIPSSGIGNRIAIPAIAIPVKGKSEFECPPEHLASFRAAIKGVTAVLTIGWRGAERHFLSLLRECELPPVSWICVAGGNDAEAAIQEIQKAGIRGDFEPRNEGFTAFVANRGIERLLNITWT